MKLGTYENLLVWQVAHELTVDICRLMKDLPRSQAVIVVTNQLIRAITSIPANIVEGYGGLGSDKALRNYLLIARRSAYETGYWLRLLRDMKAISDDQYQQLVIRLERIIALLTNFIKKL